MGLISGFRGPWDRIGYFSYMPEGSSFLWILASALEQRCITLADSAERYARFLVKAEILGTLFVGSDENSQMPPESKYSRIEWERRFLLSSFPSGEKVTRIRRINDRYIEGTRLRLRRQSDGDGESVFKLTQKLPGGTERGQQGLITSMYLTREEFDVLAALPTKEITKVRYSVPPFGIDVFEGELRGLVLAEAEFDSAAEALALILPSFIVAEVTDDRRLTGGSLVTASREDLGKWLAEYGVRLTS
jgi:CYTH domain-containing protein